MESSHHEPRLYGRLSDWYDLIAPLEEYEPEAAHFTALLERAGVAPHGSLFELGTGGGHNAYFMKKRFQMTLSDLSRDMIDLSARLNPECEHVQGDMRTLRLNREFDAVFVHDAVNYMTTEHDLRLAIRTVLAHVRPGGVALFAPDRVRDTYRDITFHGGTDRGSRGARFMEWTRDADPSDTRHTADYAFLLRDGDDVRCETDHHVLGLFPAADWVRFLGEEGFAVETVKSAVSGEGEGFAEVAFLCRRPA